MAHEIEHGIREALREKKFYEYGDEGRLISGTELANLLIDLAEMTDNKIEDTQRDIATLVDNIATLDEEIEVLKRRIESSEGYIESIIRDGNAFRYVMDKRVLLEHMILNLIESVIGAISETDKEKQKTRIEEIRKDLYNTRTVLCDLLKNTKELIGEDGYYECSPKELQECMQKQIRHRELFDCYSFQLEDKYEGRGWCRRRYRPA